MNRLLHMLVRKLLTLSYSFRFYFYYGISIKNKKLVPKTDNFWNSDVGRIGPWAQFHEAVTAVATAVNRPNYGRSYGRKSFMKLGAG